MHKHLNICVLLLLILAVLFVASCSLGQPTDIDSVNMNDITLSVPDLAAFMLSEIVFDDDLVKIDSDIALRLYGVDDIGGIVAAYGSTGATAEAIFVMRCESASDAEAARSQVEKYRSEMASVYADYNSKESGKLTNAFLTCDGRYVVFCVSPDSAAAQNAYHSFVLKNAKK